MRLMCGLVLALRVNSFPYLATRNPDSQREVTCSLVAGLREPTQPREGSIDCGLCLS